MADHSEMIDWNRLAPPPRHVPQAVQWRVRLAELKLASSPVHPLFAFVFMGLLAGVCFSGLGAIYLSDDAGVEAGPDRSVSHREHLLFVTAAVVGPLFLIATPAVLFAIVRARSNRRIHLLRSGTISPATIAKIWCYRAPYGWQPYSKVAPRLNGFRKRRGLWMAERLRKHLRQWPCKIAVDVSGRRHELAARIDLNNEGDTPEVSVLCDPQHVQDAISLSAWCDGITISEEGRFQVEESARFVTFLGAFLREAVPVVGTYATAALGLALFDSPLEADKTMPGSSLTRAGVVLLFTLSHVLIPVFFFRYYLDAFARLTALVQPARGAWLFKAVLRLFRAFVMLLVAAWFLAPAAVLAWLTGWLTLAWAVVHWALAERGTRWWVFVEYGSTSMALLAFVLSFSAARLFPLGVVVVLLQALLLAVLELKARERWMSGAAA